MKKYKLIKTYPGSPKLSTEIIETQINSLCPVNECYISGKTFMLIGDDSFEIKNPENYPEFWEKVVKKDYEILCIKHKKNKCFYRNSIDLRNLNFYDIHSVKRLSDGKVFNIGENATTALNNYGPITAFEINCNRMYIRTNGSSKGTFSCNIKDLKVFKKLFTTEDGVDIFEGDLYHAVTKKNNKMLINLNAEKEAPNFPPIWSMKDFICFSYRKKAQEYIDNHEILFSTADGVDIFEGDKYHSVILYNLQYKGWFKAQKINKGKYTDAESCIVFSTEKEAKQYILMNKPCLSLKDVGNIISFESYYLKEIKLLVKKKLKE